MRLGTARTLLAAAALAGCTHHDPEPPPITIDPVSWLAAPPGGSLAQCRPVQPTLVREIPPRALPYAVNMLADQSSLTLSDLQMKRLLPASDLDRLVEAETSAIDAEDEADRRQAIAEDPVLSTPAYRQAAAAQRLRGGELRSQQATLQPYLVRGVKARDAAGGFALCQAGGSLEVTHISNLDTASDLWFKPLIVLLPAPPTSVYVETAPAKS